MTPARIIEADRILQDWNITVCADPKWNAENWHTDPEWIALFDLGIELSDLAYQAIDHVPRYLKNPEIVRIGDRYLVG